MGAQVGRPWQPPLRQPSHSKPDRDVWCYYQTQLEITCEFGEYTCAGFHLGGGGGGGIRPPSPTPPPLKIRLIL